MTAPDLEAIRKRAAAATPGPWTAGRPDMATIVDGIDSKWIYAGDQYCAVASGRIQGEWSEVMANAEFIAASRTDVPALCDEVKRLRAENAKLREAANAVLRDFTPEHLDLIGVSMAGSKLRDALADLALRGGGG